MHSGVKREKEVGIGRAITAIESKQDDAMEMIVKEEVIASEV